MRANIRTLDDAYYIGIETHMEGVGPALRLTDQTYATREEAEEALAVVRTEHDSARICDWSDLFDMDNPVEVIWPEVAPVPDSAFSQESKVSANLRVDPAQTALHAISAIVCRAVKGELPEPVFEMVTSNWIPYMAECFIKHGSGSQQWNSVSQAFCHFMNACTGSLNFKYIKKEYGSLEDFMTGLASVLPECQFREKLQQDELKPLQEWLIKVAKPGTWFEIHVGEGKPRRVLKLSEICKQSSTLKFSDRTGKLALELEICRFLSDLKESRSALIHGEGHFENALTYLIDSNRKSVEKNLEV